MRSLITEKKCGRVQDEPDAIVKGRVLCGVTLILEPEFLLFEVPDSGEWDRWYGG